MRFSVAPHPAAGSFLGWFRASLLLPLLLFVTSLRLFLCQALTVLFLNDVLTLPLSAISLPASGIHITFRHPVYLLFQRFCETGAGWRESKWLVVSEQWL